ncbi:MAG: hypothetical protein FH753_15700 [Firmicutes bacterium]|nr:hypothetical protein [Bacillota bacterium]
MGKGKGRFITGLMLGTLIGGTLGVLLAPEKGEENREKLKEKGKEIGNKIYDSYSEIKDSIKEYKENKSSEIHTMPKEIVISSDDIKEKVKENIEKEDIEG